MNEHYLSTNARALGIRVSCAMLHDEALWYWQHVAPAPSSSWSGPYDSAEAAHAAAVRALLYFAQLGRQALENMESSAVDEAEEEIPAPSWWTRAFEDEGT